ncbi:MAG: hypothetical protein ABSB83_05790 [Methanomassiliicoccales archaeon]|jgi:hypothetical protein
MMFCSLLLPAAATAGVFVLIKGSEGPIEILAALAVFLLGMTLLSLVAKWRDVLVASVGVLIVMDVFAVVLLSDASVIVAWSIFAVGIVALTLGANGVSMWGMVQTHRKVDPRIEAHFRRAIRRSVVSILLFVAAVMMVSIIALAFSVGLEIPGFSLFLLASCVVAAMVTMTLLASGRAKAN